MNETAFNDKLKSLQVGKVQAFDFQVERWAYGSGVQSKTLFFALVVNCAYLAFVIIHHVAALVMYLRVRLGVKKEAGLVKSWGDMQQLMALALKSVPPEELDNTGSGVKARSTWRKNVGIRVNEDRDLELVFEAKTTGMMRAHRGMKYG